MADRSLKPKKKKPFNYFTEVRAAQKRKKTSVPVPDLATPLRRDMVPASDAQPAGESVLNRENVRVAVGILLGLVILGMILITLVGPGRPILEQSLVNLERKTVTPTQTVTITQTSTHTRIPPTDTPIPTQTSSPSPTNQPTRTHIVASIASPTQILPSSTPTPPGCRDVLSITLDDVGKTLCVQGEILEIISNPTDFMVIFSVARAAFYWVTYDLVWSNAEVGTCYRVTGKINQIMNSPVLVFDYRNLPEICP